MMTTQENFSSRRRFLQLGAAGAGALLAANKSALGSFARRPEARPALTPPAASRCATGVTASDASVVDPASGVATGNSACLRSAGGAAAA